MSYLKRKYFSNRSVTTHQTRHWYELCSSCLFKDISLRIFFTQVSQSICSEFDKCKYRVYRNLSHSTTMCMENNINRSLSLTTKERVSIINIMAEHRFTGKNNHIAKVNSAVK